VRFDWAKSEENEQASVKSDAPNARARSYKTLDGHLSCETSRAQVRSWIKGVTDPDYPMQQACKDWLKIRALEKWALEVTTSCDVSE